MASPKSQQNAQPESGPTARPATRSATTATPGEGQARKRTGRKRGDGEGSIYQRKGDGLWVASVMVGRRLDGRPDRRVVYGKTRGEAQKKLNELRQRDGAGTLGAATDERETLGAYLHRWLDAVQPRVRVRTHERYAQLMRVHVIPPLGRTKLAAVKPDALERLYAAKLAAGLSPRTVHHIHTVLHTAIEQAMRWGHVPRNVVDVVTPPKVPRRELHPPTGAEVGRLLDTAANAGDRLCALWALATFTGCRLGELTGLTWDDVELAAGTLSVRRILVRVGGFAPVYGEPKTDRSRRLVPLPPEAVAALRAHRSRQNAERLALGKDYGEYGLVFATRIGSPLDRKVVQEQFKRALKQADLPPTVRFHDLRHAAATLMLANGEDIPTVAAILGHSQNSTTLNIYAHAVPAKLLTATSAIQRAIRGIV